MRLSVLPAEREISYWLAEYSALGSAVAQALPARPQAEGVGLSPSLLRLKQPETLGEVAYAE